MSNKIQDENFHNSTAPEKHLVLIGMNLSEYERDNSLSTEIKIGNDRSAAERQPLLTSLRTSESIAVPCNDETVEDGFPRSQLSTPNNGEVMSYVLMGLATIGFSSNSLLIHVAETKYKFPTASSVLIRGVVQTVLCLTYLISMSQLRTTIRSINAPQFRLLCVRGVVGSLAMMCLYLSVRLIPVGDAIAIVFVGPAITIVLSKVFLHESATIVEYIAAALSVSGAVLITRHEASSPGQMEIGWRNWHVQALLGYLAAVMSATLASIGIMAVRRLSTAVHFITIVLAFSVCAIPTAILFGGILPVEQFFVYGAGLTTVTTAAVIAFCSQCCIAVGLQSCRVAPAVLLLNLEVPISYVLGLIFMNEGLSVVRVVGSALVFLSAVLIGAQSAA